MQISIDNLSSRVVLRTVGILKVPKFFSSSLVSRILFKISIQMKLNTEQRVRVILIYGAELDITRTVTSFNGEFQGIAHTTYNTVKTLVDKFKATGSVADLPRSGRPKFSEVQELAILGTVAQNPQTSTRQNSAQNNIPRSTVRRVLKRHKFHPWKPSCHQELFLEDFDRRIHFCETINAKKAQDPAFLKHICFTDEATFWLNGHVNRSNVRYWAEENPHILFETQTQYPQKLNVWCGIFGDHIIGPFFIDGTLDGDKYLQLLEEAIDPRITEIVETDVTLLGDPVYDENKITFQHDGCPAHFSHQVTQYLNHNYPLRWIGRGGPILWPPRSPDLTPLDFFLWGHLKSVVYKSKVHSLEELRQRIVDECAKITPAMLQKVRAAFEDRMYYCLAENGSHFEHKI